MAPDGAIVTLNGRVVFRETVNDSPPILQPLLKGEVDATVGSRRRGCRDMACRVRKITAILRQIVMETIGHPSA